MAYCTSCGRKLEDDDAFCPSCGRPVECNSGKTTESEKYDGVVHKCPNCGQTVDAFEVTCPSCGYEFRGVESTSRVNDLAIKLENISDIKRRNELITNFYIPNTKEDIYEFFILATSNIAAGGDSTDAWYAKLDQAYKKAMLVFGDGPELERLNRLYKEGGATKSNRTLITLAKKRGVQISALVCLAIVMVLIAFSIDGDLRLGFGAAAYILIMAALFIASSAFD